jgi:hypothetical protein
MRQKKTVKFVLAGITAFLVLNVFCLVYYNMPGHISVETGATDYVYPKFSRYSQLVEGFGYGKLNNEGYNNTDDYKAQKIDILLMGSSHIEGLNVAQRETTTSALNALLKSRYTYNIGFSTHDFLRNLNNLRDAVSYYKPQGYVVLEIQNIVFSVQEIESVIYSRMDRLPSFDHGILSYLQRMPYLRLGYRQIKFLSGLHVVDMFNFFKRDNSKAEDDSNIINWDQMAILLDSLMARTRKICIDNDINFIIVYHPHLTIQKDGSVSTDYFNEYLAELRSACHNNGIYFIDMTDVFIEEYNNNHILPHGFSNTAVCSGHLNNSCYVRAPLSPVLKADSNSIAFFSEAMYICAFTAK